MGLVRPDEPTFDLAAFRAAPYHERVRLLCLDWVAVGFGAPAYTYGVYLVKALLYVGGWYLLVRAGGVEGGITEWWSSPVAFAKGILWTMLFEGLGLGCGSGPLTGRYMPPFAALGHYLRPGTIRLPAFPGLPGTRGDTRTLLDVALYLGHVLAVGRVLVADEVTAAGLLPVMVFLPLLALRDKQAFLSARGEHYFTTTVVLLALDSGIGADTTWAQVPLTVIAGAKAVQLSIWWWAATSKLNHHFPYVVGVMLSNHPLNRSQALRRRLFRDHPTDLRPGAIPTLLAHGGTVIEYGFPLLLVLSDGGLGTTVGLVVMTAFHLWIFSSFALGVPQEWNVFFIYSMHVLFGATTGNAAVKPWEIGNGAVLLFLVVVLVVVPVVGNILPDRVSFLTSMRYYAGNWGASSWIFTPDALERFDTCLTKAAPELRRQLAFFFDDDTTEVALSRVVGFRAMHLHGRLVQRLVTRAVEEPNDHVIREGELVAGMALGWNFGDLHLHHEQLLQAVQRRCGFAPGELRVVMVESQPFQVPTWDWRIVDAADGQLLAGTASVAEALDQTPWPEPSTGSIAADAGTLAPMPQPVHVAADPTEAGRTATADTPTTTA